MKNTKPIHCYLVDDDPEEIEIFQLALQELDITVKCSPFTNCDEALTSLKQENPSPDCIFLDLYMGAQSGKECLTKIMTTEIIAHIPVIMLSGSRNEPEIAELKTLGAREFMIKSLTIQELKDQLENYFTTQFDLNAGLSI